MSDLELHKAVAELGALLENLGSQHRDLTDRLSDIDERLRQVEIRLAKLSERTVLFYALSGGGVGSVLGAGLYKLISSVLGGS